MALFYQLKYWNIDAEISTLESRALHHPYSYATMAPPDQIDFSIEARLSAPFAGNNTHGDACKRYTAFHAIHVLHQRAGSTAE
jgi:hypothetical protein